MGLLESIRGPRDLRRLSQDELTTLAEEIRTFLVTSVARTGGHLGPNLGVVELTLALHRVFDSPRDRLVWDTGHQAYVHKMVTGRLGDFATLKRKGGLSGYPSQAESDHDIVENSHASTSLSYADGLAKAHQLRGLTDRHVVAVIGDGALTGGMAWEALNNIAADKTRRLVIVVNDNERSYAPTIGGLAHYLATLRTTRGYERFLEWGKNLLGRTPVVGAPIYDTLHGVKKGLKDIVAPQGMFEDLGLKYVGPDRRPRHRGRRARAAPGARLQRPGARALHHPARARATSSPLRRRADNFHGIGVIDPDTGLPLSEAPVEWGEVFGDELVAIGEERPDVVAITAAMLLPTRLGKFAERFPDRVFDVGIAEQHAATSAAGLAIGGLHPVFAVYATFLNRAFDQVLMDVALHGCGVTFVLDRAGVTGNDGPSHNGMWDMAILQVVPGCASPRRATATTLRERAARGRRRRRRADRGAVPQGCGLAPTSPPWRPSAASTCCSQADDRDVLLVSVGAMAETCLEVAPRCARQGIGVTVVDPRWVKPLPTGARSSSPRDYRCLVTVEDGIRAGGVGSMRRADAARRRGRRRRCATSASRPASSTTPSAPRCWPRSV